MKLLVICHSYNSFQKDPIELLAPSFSSINVFVRTNPIAEIAGNLSLSGFEGFSTRNMIDLTNVPPQVDVSSTKIWYLPTKMGYIKLGDKHHCAVGKKIKEKKISFDMVHAHFTWSSGYVGARLKEQFQVPLIVTAHGYDIYHLPFKDDEWKERIKYVLNAADAIITVSRSNLECISRLSIDTPVHVIPNGFRSDLFFQRDKLACCRELNLPSDKKIILTIGSLDVAVKGQGHLIAAIKQIASIRDDILCIIMGMGKDKKALEKQIHSMGLGKFVRLIGGKPHDEIPIWINACDLFVLPSLSEGNPTVMFEALGCGKPFIGTAVGGIPEIIISNECGLLVRPGDASDLAEKILLALDKEWDQDTILDYAEQFNWKNITKKIMKIFSHVSILHSR